jgi:hypothetical protein
MALGGLGLLAGCGGSGGSGDEPFGGDYTVKTALVSTTCANITVGQGNTHTATITNSGGQVSISDNSGLTLSGSLSSKNLTAAGSVSVPVSSSCTTSNTVNLTATVPDSSTVQGTARIQITYPASCAQLSGRTCTADLKYEAIRPVAAGQPTTTVSTIPAGTLLWGNPVRLGGGGTYPAVDVDTNGIAHALYRREKRVYYRRFDGKAWGAEVRANDDNSLSEVEIKDRNLPKVAIDDKNNAWLLWGGDLPTLNMYIRGVDANGNFTTPIHQLRITEVLPNMGAGGNGPSSQGVRPEEVALSFSHIDKKLHVAGFYIGDTDGLHSLPNPRDGVYDMIIDPATLVMQAATKLGNASKNLYAISGPNKTHGIFRLTVPVYYRWDGGTYTRTTPGEPPHHGVLGAVNIWTTDDSLIHSTTISTYPVGPKADPKNYTDRDLSYAKFDPAQGKRLLEVVKIEENFHSPIGIPPILIAPGGHILIAYDRSIRELSPPVITALNTTQELGIAWRPGTASSSAFDGPSTAFFWPGRAVNLGQEPATAISGSTIHLVWDGKQTGSFDAAWATFQP